jgi:hypothetical protein
MSHRSFFLPLSFQKKAATINLVGVMHDPMPSLVRQDESPNGRKGLKEERSIPKGARDRESEAAG